MAKRLLTKTLLQGLTGPTEVRDERVPGLVTRVTSKGVVSLGVRWKVGGKDRREHLGRWPDEISIDEARRKARRKTAAPKARPKNPPNLSDTAKRWLEAEQRRVERGKKRASSVAANETHLRLAILPELGSVPLHALTRAKIHDWLDTLSGGPGVNRQLATLKAMLNWAVDRELIESNPAARIRPPVDEAPRERVLSEDEIRAFWRAPLPETPHRALKLALVTGARLGEVAGLWHRDIRDDVWHLDAQSAKGRRGRKIPLTELAQELIGEGSGLVFGLQPRSISQALARHREKAGIGDVTAHDLRRTCVSMLVSALGYPESTVSAVLGHAPQTVTGKHYAIVGEATAREALERWAEHLEAIVSQRAGDT